MNASLIVRQSIFRILADDSYEDLACLNCRIRSPKNSLPFPFRMVIKKVNLPELDCADDRWWLF